VAQLVSEHEPIPHLFVVGNKPDLADRRQVSEDRGQEVANSIGADYPETSAKTGSGIESRFAEVAKAVNTPEQKPEVTPSVKLAQTPPSKTAQEEMLQRNSLAYSVCLVYDRPTARPLSDVRRTHRLHNH
jgi:hypothetical protein